jgi:hypothetical protein
MVTAARTIGYTQADGRKLSSQDHYFFDNCFAPLNTILSMSSRGLPKNDAKIQAAFRQVVATSPLLQTVVDETNNTYRKVHKARWPTLLVAPKVDRDANLMAQARLYLNQEVQKMSDGGQEAQRKSIYAMVLMRSPTRLAFLCVTPHHFVDGTGLGVKLCQYARTPRVFWPALNRLSTEHVPTFYEMGLKKDFGKLDGLLEQANATESAKQDPRNFHFPDHGASAPVPSPPTCTLETTLASVRGDTLRLCCKRLKNVQEGKLSLTSAFGALSIKTLANLLVQSGAYDGSSSAPLLGTVGVDARFLGSWGDARDSLRRFPVVGNYAFSGTCQVPMNEAVAMSVEELGQRVKQTFSRLRTDVEYRVLSMKASAAGMLPTSGMFVGCSSVVLPWGASAVTGIRNVEIDARTC